MKILKKKFIMIVEDDKCVEKCAKLFAKAFQYKANKELYKMHNDNLKKIIFNCAEIDKDVIENIKSIKSSSNTNLNTYVVYDNSKTIEYLNLDGNIIGMEKKSNKSIKTQNINNKISKRLTKKY